MATETQAEIDRINTEVSTQASKIAQLSSILDGKAAGGGGGVTVETCTLTIVGAGLYGASNYVAFMAVEEGAIVQKTVRVNGNAFGSQNFTCVKNTLVAYSALKGTVTYTGSIEELTDITTSGMVIYARIITGDATITSTTSGSSEPD